MVFLLVYGVGDVDISDRKRVKACLNHGFLHRDKHPVNHRVKTCDRGILIILNS